MSRPYHRASTGPAPFYKIVTFLNRGNPPLRTCPDASGRQRTTLPRLGSRVRIPSPAPRADRPGDGRAWSARAEQGATAALSDLTGRSKTGHWSCRWSSLCDLDTEDLHDRAG